MRAIVGLVLALSLIVSVKGQAKLAAPVTPPTITEAQKLAYFKANAEFLAAQQQAQQTAQLAQAKQAVLQEAVKGITDACGKKFQPTMDPQGMPTCVVVSEPPVADVKK